MCDSLLIQNEKSGHGHPFLLKNSDREPNEAQEVFINDGNAYPYSQVNCTYRAVAHVKKPFACILSKPFHMWGAEMGLNEHGLAIANEAVFTKFKFEKKNDGLTGMDMIRLALESCKTADEALNKISGWIESIGQDACGGYYDQNFYYHNSFLIADPKHAWKLESAGRFWAAKQIIEPIESISNGLTIAGDYDQGSAEMETFARSKNWIKAPEEFQFNKAFSDRLYTHFSKCQIRRNITKTGADSEDKMTFWKAREILSGHSHKRLDRLDASSICMHANSLLNPSQTTGSMIAELIPDRPFCWLTGTANPCMSIYFPILPDALGLRNQSLLKPGAKYDQSLWWAAENVHRLLIRTNSNQSQEYNQERVSIQAEITEGWQVAYNQKSSSSGLIKITESSIEQTYAFYTDWASKLNSKEDKSHWKYRWYRRKFDSMAGIDF